jgi:hypothetical protein
VPLDLDRLAQGALVIEDRQVLYASGHRLAWSAVRGSVSRASV